MKQLTIHIPDGKFHFVLELLNNLPFVKIDAPAESFTITEGQKRLVEEERKKIKTDPNYLLDWDNVQHELNA